MRNPPEAALSTVVAVIALALLAFSSFSTALTAEEGGKFYANPGESVSTALFSNEGFNYAMVKLGGVESVILREVEGGYDVELDSAKYPMLVKAYLSAQFDALGFTMKAAGVKVNFNSIQNEESNCIKAANSFVIRAHTTVPYIYIYAAGVTTFAAERKATEDLKAAIPGFETVFKSMNDSVPILDQAVSNRDVDTVVSTLSTINVKAKEFKTIFQKISNDHAVLMDNFPHAFFLNGNPNNCELAPNESSAIDAIISSSDVGPLKSVSEMTAYIDSQTQKRRESALNRMLASTQEQSLAAYSKKVSDLRDAYKAAAEKNGFAAITLDALLKKYGELNTLYQSVKDNSASGNTSAAEAQFKKKGAELEIMTSSYNATLRDYNASVTAVSNASSQINNAIKRYVTGDTRVSGLQKELQELRLSLKANEDKLKNALFSQIAFKTLAQNASNVAFRAANLPPKESEFDFVLLGGVIVLVAAFAYAIFYLRKKRPPRETGLPVGRAEFAEKINVGGPGAGGI
ncbi:hypothetical protein H0N96_00510 [Candidatus Micrarchaeota archaeon]|nr:hypothetical protein [Candidatus Micrarchaeota archaeon]